MDKVIKFEATITIQDSRALIGDSDQTRDQFWDQVRNHSVLHVNGDLGQGVGVFTEIRISAKEPTQ